MFIDTVNICVKQRSLFMDRFRLVWENLWGLDFLIEEFTD